MASGAVRFKTILTQGLAGNEHYSVEGYLIKIKTLNIHQNHILLRTCELK